MVQDVHVRNYRPSFVIDQDGVRQYVDMPLQARATDSLPAPSMAPNAAVEPSLISP
jgi:hypothetical protein